MAYTVYGDKVLFVSSAQESFGFVVHSTAFAHLMSLQFDVLWGGITGPLTILAR